MYRTSGEGVYDSRRQGGSEAHTDAEDAAGQLPQSQVMFHVPGAGTNSPDGHGSHPRIGGLLGTAAGPASAALVQAAQQRAHLHARGAVQFS